MEMQTENKPYPRYFRKMGTAIKRTSDVKGQMVRIPDTTNTILPLMMTEVYHPTKERFDEEVKNMEEVDLACYEDYIYGFIGRVESGISKPMTERSIKKQLESIAALQLPKK